MRPLGSWQRVLSAAFLLALTATFLHFRQKNELLPQSRDLSLFPSQIEDRKGRDITIDSETLEVLGPGNFLLRDYSSSAAGTIPVNLFIAYFPSQRIKDTIHSPKNCLPGSGWTPTSSARILFTRSDGSQVSINRYAISKDLNRALVLYWYQAHGRVTASEYWAKWYLLMDAIRINRTDGALVRVVIPIVKGNDESAQAEGFAFLRQIAPLLDAYIPY